MRQFQSILIGIFIIILLVPGGFAEPLVSLDRSFTERWNNGNIALPDPGQVILPKGPGIVTITEVQEPWVKAGTQYGPDQVTFSNPGKQNEIFSPGTFLGTTYYQKGAVVSTKQGISEGLALTSVTRYYSERMHDETLTIQLLPAIVINTNHQLANRVKLAVSWEPLDEGRAINPGCDITGSWKTNWGNMSLDESYSSFNQKYTIIGSYVKKNQGTFQGELTGPVLTGEWAEPDAKSLEDSGRFTFFLKDNCCAFTGTWGTGDSDTNGGEWSGIRY